MNAIENVKREQRKQQTVQPITYQKLTSSPHHSITVGTRSSQPTDLSNGVVSVVRRPSPQSALRNDPSVYYSVNNIPNTATATATSSDNHLEENLSPPTLPVISHVQSDAPSIPIEQTGEESDDSSGGEEYEEEYEEEEPRKSCCIF